MDFWMKFYGSLLVGIDWIEESEHDRVIGCRYR